MKRRQYLTATGTVLATALAGCSSSDDPPEDDENGGNGGNGGGNGGNGGGNGDEATPTDTPEPTATPAPEFDPIEFSDDKPVVTDTFTLSGGFTAIDYSHDGSSNFQVTVVDPSGSERDRLAANEIGRVTGAWAEGLPEGDYVLDVEADGSWEATVRQPRVPEGGGDSLPVSMDGDETDHYQAIVLDGTARVSGRHEGDGNFQVHSYTRHGETHLGTLVFNEIGNFEGETTLDYDGSSWIFVEADGAWQLEFEEL